ncbi:MAG: hypothetical protein P1P88_21165, partial [Bacteroidales bacterium]|nr:hypothetical protein [Bacteroidales bacterium]
MRKNFWSLLRFLRLAGILQLSYRGILDEYGWYKSFYAKKSIDKKGAPIPWYSYSAIDFLSGRLNNQMKIFEFGSGNSTIWFATRTKNVVAVEHDLNWFKAIKSSMSSNVDIRYKSLIYNGEYCRTAAET